jgi:hypothetical protein
MGTGNETVIVGTKPEMAAFFEPQITVGHAKFMQITEGF